MKQNIINYSIIAGLLLLFSGLVICSSHASAISDSDKVGELAKQINDLQNIKETCYNDLTYRESILLYEGKERFCFQRDDEIMRLREEQEKLTDHEYMGLVKETQQSL